MTFLHFHMLAIVGWAFLYAGVPHVAVSLPSATPRVRAIRPVTLPSALIDTSRTMHFDHTQPHYASASATLHLRAGSRVMMQAAFSYLRWSMLFDPTCAC